MQKFYLKLIPYFISLFTAILLFLIFCYPNILQFHHVVFEFAVGVASISFLFICYEFTKYLMYRKIQIKVRNYVGGIVSQNLCDLLKYFYAWFYAVDDDTLELDNEKASKIFLLSSDDIEKFLSEANILGFFIYKNVSFIASSINSILKNNSLNEYITSAEKIYFLDILRNISFIRQEIFEFIPVNVESNLYIEVDNSKDTYLTLKNGDLKIESALFDNVDRSKLLRYYKVPTEMVELLSEQIYDLIVDIREIVSVMHLTFCVENLPYIQKK